jgi:hypothetical protein
MKNLLRNTQAIYFIAFSSMLLLLSLIDRNVAKAGPINENTIESESVCIEAFDFSITPSHIRTNEFTAIEKSDFNTSLLPSYYHEMECNPESKKVLLVIYDVLGREAYTRVILDHHTFVYSLNLENNLCSGVYMIFGASDQRFYKQKLAIE